jgi:hypothetical protein
MKSVKRSCTVEALHHNQHSLGRTPDKTKHCDHECSSGTRAACLHLGQLRAEPKEVAALDLVTSKLAD